MTATLRLTRHANGMVIELRRGQFEIDLDGKAIGTIAYSETVEAEIDPGHHVLKIRSGRYSSRDLAFDVTDGVVAAFRCHGPWSGRDGSRPSSSPTGRSRSCGNDRWP